MHTDDFDFYLPEELIAQTPLKDRSASRLLVLDDDHSEQVDDHFSNITRYFKKGDCLVLNDTRVLPARLFGVKEDTGAKVEILLLEQKKEDYWEALVKPARKVKEGTTVTFGDGKLTAICVQELEHGARIFELQYNGILYEVLDELGEMPLPPYIKEQLEDQERYQTVYGKEEGSAAAPTAGLHFTTELLKEMEDMGVEIVYITLHVGLGTFRPVSVEDIAEHKMHSEYYRMSEETAETLTKANKEKRRVIAVGTTAARTLETISRDHGNRFIPCSGWTDIFIYPPYDIKSMDGLITNFHLPKSTLIMLVSAFIGKDSIMEAYNTAVRKKYRFFSFGDAMLILARRNV